METAMTRDKENERGAGIGLMSMTKLHVLRTIEHTLQVSKREEQDRSWIRLITPGCIGQLGGKACWKYPKRSWFKSGGRHMGVYRQIDKVRYLPELHEENTGDGGRKAGGEETIMSRSLVAIFVVVSTIGAQFLLTVQSYLAVLGADIIISESEANLITPPTSLTVLGDSLLKLMVSVPHLYLTCYLWLICGIFLVALFNEEITQFTLKIKRIMKEEKKP